MPSKSLASIAWNDLPGKWILVVDSKNEHLNGCLCLVKTLDKSALLRNLICNPYIVSHSQNVGFYNSDRILTVDMRSYEFSYYDCLDDMKDDVMLEWLASRQVFHPILLALEIDEFRNMVGIDGRAFKYRNAKMSIDFNQVKYSHDVT